MAKQSKQPNQPSQPNNESFKEQRDLLKEINSEIGKQKTAIQEAAKSYSILESIAFKLQNTEEEITNLDEKQLKSLKAKSEIALRELKAAAERIQKEKKITDLNNINKKIKQSLNSEEQAILKAAKEKFKVEEDFVKNVGEELKTYGKINKQLEKRL